ncbi:MAG: arylesterase [Gammaproteobacteria bacterium]|nr:arylesterase [Gammaproteobacteria bacterium]
MQHIIYRVLLILVIGLPAGVLAHSTAKILILGDSLSAAYNMPLEQGWVSLLQDRVEKTMPGAKVINASISGETAANAVNRLPQLIIEHRPDVIVIELGGNDGLRGFKLSEIEQNLQRLIDISNQAGASVVLTGLYLNPNYGPRFNTQFNQIFSKLAKRNGTGLVPFILEGIGDDPGKMQTDAIHPTADAQPQILENMWPHIRNAIIAIK